jgi:hypothetical protein
VAERIQRTIPTSLNPVTNETIHPSALCQRNPNSRVVQAVQQTPELVWRLLPHEEVVKEHWHIERAPTDSEKQNGNSVRKDIGHILHDIKVAVKDGSHGNTSHTLISAFKHKDGGQPGSAVPINYSLAKFTEESNMGKVVKEILHSS